MTQKLALFDLDNTLLAGDSDHAWGEFLIARKLVDETTHRAENDRHYAAYQRGELDIHAYVAFTINPVLGMDPQQRQALHDEFMEHYVLPMVLPQGRELVASHQESGDCCVMVTATNEFITAPIAEIFGIEHLLATELERIDGDLTGKIAGTPCYQMGKVIRLQEWLARRQQPPGLENAVFYTDSINDLPLLRLVPEPVAIDPDESLARVCEEQGWPVRSLR